MTFMFPPSVDRLPFEIGESPVSKSELKTAEGCFKRLFVPILQQNGFVPKKGKWYRKYCNYQMQSVCFLPSPSRSFCYDLRILCDYTTLASSSLSIQWLCTCAVDLQQKLIHQVYPGCEKCRLSSRLVYKDGTQTAERVMYIMPDYFSCYCARKKGDSVEVCMDREYHLFLEQTLPTLNSFQTPRDYLDYVYRVQDQRLLNTFTNERFYHSTLWCHDWDSAAKSCHAAIVAATEAKKEIETLETDLLHINQHDTEWADKVILSQVGENEEIVRKTICHERKQR